MQRGRQDIDVEADGSADDDNMFRQFPLDISDPVHELLGYTSTFASEYRVIDDSILYLFAAMTSGKRIIVCYGDFVCKAPAINRIKRIHLSTPDSHLSECTIACVAAYSVLPPRLLICTENGEILSTLLAPLLGECAFATAPTAFHGQAVEIANGELQSSSSSVCIPFDRVMRNSKSVYNNSTSLLPPDCIALCMCIFPGGVILGFSEGYLLAVQISKNGKTNHLCHDKGDYEEVVKLRSHDIKSIRLCHSASQKCIVIEDTQSNVHLWLLRQNSDDSELMLLDRLIALRTRNPGSMSGVSLLTEEAGNNITLILIWNNLI